MLNYIWTGMILVSIITGICSGNAEAVTKGAIEGCSAGVELCISMLGIMCFWTGVAKIAEKSGLVNVFARLLRPVTKFIFPNLQDNSPAHFAIIMNMVANILGMGNAATPLGLKAMSELDKLDKSEKMTYEMCAFTVLNTASVQLIPSTVISLRQSFGSANPSVIILPIWIVSLCSAAVSVLAVKFFKARGKI